jgi:hypothetical protein
MRYVRDFGRVFSWCQSCTPICMIALPGQEIEEAPVRVEWEDNDIWSGRAVLQPNDSPIGHLVNTPSGLWAVSNGLCLLTEPLNKTDICLWLSQQGYR